MPCIKSFDNCKIYLYPKDHMPPHFHVITHDAEWLVRISDGMVLKGTHNLRAIHTALEWAVENRALLLTRFLEMNS